MSLQVWLPLDGDLRNYGLKGDLIISQIESPTYVDGKIGKCYQRVNNTATQSTNGININNNLVDLLGTTASIAVWIKPYGNHTHYNGTIISSGNWNDQTWAFGVNQDNTYVDVFSGGHNQYINCVIPTNTWTHLVSIFDNGKCTIYKNGVFVGEITGRPNFASNATNTCIGRETYASGYFGFNGCINDLRIYDHCLSLREIKELAKGLILHYPLNKPMPNLLSKYVTPGQANPGVTATAGRTNYLGNYSIQIPAAENADTYFRLFLTKELIQNNKYTFSCYVSGLKKGTYYNFPFFAQGNTGMGVIHLDHNGLNTVTFTMNSSRQNAITDPEGKTVYIMFMDDSGRNIASGQQPFQITQMKLEEGDKVTGFIPNEYDPLYAAAGYASGIVYDCSGYQNNGVEVGTITGSSDTPRYRSSEYFDGSSCIKNIVVPFDLSVCNREMTTSCWIKKTIQDNNTERTYINYIMRLFVYTNGKFRINWNHATDNLSYNITNTWDTGIDVPYNKWTHIVFTFQEGIMKIYINGILRNTSDRTNNANRIRGYIGQCIGARDDSFTTSFIGNISDVRVYATALSAVDVKALYNDSASIDKNGNFHAYEYVEDGNRVDINKQGVFTVPEEIMENSLKEPSIDEKNIYAKGEFYED